MDDTSPIEIPTPNGSVRCITFEADKYHLVYGDYSGNVYRCKFDTGVALSSSVMKAESGLGVMITSSMDGQWIVYVTQNALMVWSTTSKQVSKQIRSYYGQISVVDISNDSKRIAYAEPGNSTLYISDIVFGAQSTSLQNNGPIAGVKFSPDGNRIATATNQRASVCVFDANSRTQLFDIPVLVDYSSNIPSSLFAWSPDGQQLFVASPGKITCLDTSTSFYSNWSILTLEKNVSIVFHGRFIACSAGPSISFWDYTSRERIGTIVNNQSNISCIALSYGGRYLACGRGKAIVVHDLGDILPPDYLQVPLVSPMSFVQVSNPVLTSWVVGSATDTEKMLSEEITKGSRLKHCKLAARSLVRARLKEWKLALEDAEASLQIEQSPLGRTAKSLALIGTGRLEDARDEFDFVFHDRTDRSDNTFLLVIKSILLFLCGKYSQGTSHLRELIDVANEKTRDHYMQVLAYMYLKQRDYEHAVQTLELAKTPPDCKHANPLMTITLIFNWKFDNIKATAWEQLCQSLYVTSNIKEVGERLLTMANVLPEEEREAAHGRILETIVTRSGDVTLLEWTGKASKCNSCLPSSPAVYTRDRAVLASLDKAELEKRSNELRAVFSPTDATFVYGRVTRLQPVLFVRFQLHLPCIVFGIQGLVKVQDNTYRAQTTEFGDVEFITADVLPLEDPERLVFADLRIHGLLEPSSRPVWKCDLEPDMVANSAADPVNRPIIEEVPTMSGPVDMYACALELIAHLGQPFSPLLFFKQADHTYRRVAADHEFAVRGTGSNFPKDVRVEVLVAL